ncbi:MAG TPA: hypothetical protein VFE32_02940 [Puia sp.]|jgi:hypothetical protein|nr:hypothetical protein [Puia sp.]
MDSLSLYQIYQTNRIIESCDRTIKELTAGLKTFLPVSPNRPNYQTNDRAYIAIGDCILSLPFCFKDCLRQLHVAFDVTRL